MVKGQWGLTLVELIVTLAVLATVIAVAMPLFGGLLAGNHAATQSEALASALKLARSEAMTRGAPVSVKAGGLVWTDGWSVFMDEDADGDVDPNEVLRVWHEPPSGTTVKGVTGVETVVFERSGASLVAHAFQVGHSSAGDSNAFCVSVARNGHISRAREACLP